MPNHVAPLPIMSLALLDPPRQKFGEPSSKPLCNESSLSGIETRCTRGQSRQQIPVCPPKLVPSWPSTAHSCGQMEVPMILMEEGKVRSMNRFSWYMGLSQKGPTTPRPY